MGKGPGGSDTAILVIVFGVFLRRFFFKLSETRDFDSTDFHFGLDITLLHAVVGCRLLPNEMTMGQTWKHAFVSVLKYVDHGMGIDGLREVRNTPKSKNRPGTSIAIFDAIRGREKGSILVT